MNAATAVSSMLRVFGDSALDVVPLFLLAIFIGALIEEFVSERFIARFMTGRNPGTMLLGSFVGALIPLCTCGMVPLAVALRRRGGDLKHTFGFLTAGAAVSIPVLLLTWRLLGPSWVGIRLLASMALGLLAGYASVFVLRSAAPRSAETLAGRDEVVEMGLTPLRGSRFRAVWRCFLGQVREYAPWVLVSLALAAVVEVSLTRGAAGLIAVNTTIARASLGTDIAPALRAEPGGLSGRPLRARALEVVRVLARLAGDRLPIIGCGGIATVDDARRMLDAGAALLQLYTGFIYEGPLLARHLARGLSAAAAKAAADSPLPSAPR